METIILPQHFKYPKYMYGAWLDIHRRWDGESLRLLVSALDLGVHFDDASNAIGRNPEALYCKAREMRLRLPSSWKKRFGKKFSAKCDPYLQYPYLVKPDDKYSDLIAVNRLVSKALPGREDVCQDIMLALWESKTSLQELKDDPRAIRAFIKSFRKLFFEKSGYGVESLDVTVYGDDGGNKHELSKYQRSLINHDDQNLEDFVFGERGMGYTADFSSGLIQQLSKEEEEIGVPAALWLRAEKFIYES